MLSRKPQIEEHKKSAEGKLAARLELLKTKGMDAKQIQKDARIKQIKAQIRKAKHQMGGIAAMEALTAEKADARAQKAAAAKAPRQEPKKAPKSAAPKKPKKEKKPAAQE
jgi:hypothetical protein